MEFGKVLQKNDWTIRVALHLIRFSPLALASSYQLIFSPFGTREDDQKPVWINFCNTFRIVFSHQKANLKTNVVSIFFCLESSVETEVRVCAQYTCEIAMKQIFTYELPRKIFGVQISSRYITRRSTPSNSAGSQTNLSSVHFYSK